MTDQKASFAASSGFRRDDYSSASFRFFIPSRCNKALEHRALLLGCDAHGHDSSLKQQPGHAQPGIRKLPRLVKRVPDLLVLVLLPR